MDSTSETGVYVWTWLPGRTEPAVAGRVRAHGGRYLFGYGRSYLDRPDAISLYAPELPLRPGWQAPLQSLAIASVLRDAAPDAWGQRVILERLHGRRAHGTDPGDLGRVTKVDGVVYGVSSGMR